MHEMYVVKQMLDIVERQAKDNGIKKVTCISLKIGTLTFVVEDLVMKMYKFYKRDTICEDASLSIEWIPGVAECENCKKLSIIGTQADISEYICKKCGCKKFDLLSGIEFIVEEIQGE